jgi:hypothetical protein
MNQFLKGNKKFTESRTDGIFPVWSKNSSSLAVTCP